MHRAISIASNGVLNEVKCLLLGVCFGRGVQAELLLRQPAGGEQGIVPVEDHHSVLVM